MIPARRYGTITITFTPLKCDVLESGLDLNGYAHGHMSLDAPNVRTHSHMLVFLKTSVEIVEKFHKVEHIYVMSRGATNKLTFLRNI